MDDLAWTPDSETIYFLSGVGGEEPVFKVEIAGKHLAELTGRGAYGDLHLTPDGEKLILSRTTLRQPAEIYVLRTKEESETPPRNLDAAPFPYLRTVPRGSWLAGVCCGKISLRT